jgi:hypothetical protein
LGAAKRTLDGEDRSEMLAKAGKAGRRIGEGWYPILVPSLAASNSCHQYPDAMGYGKHFEAIVRAWRPATEANQRKETL